MFKVNNVQYVVSGKKWSSGNRIYTDFDPEKTDYETVKRVERLTGKKARWNRVFGRVHPVDDHDYHGKQKYYVEFLAATLVAKWGRKKTEESPNVHKKVDTRCPHCGLVYFSADAEYLRDWPQSAAYAESEALLRHRCPEGTVRMAHRRKCDADMEFLRQRGMWPWS